MNNKKHTPHQKASENTHDVSSCVAKHTSQEKSCPGSCCNTHSTESEEETE